MASCTVCSRILVTFLLTLMLPLPRVVFLWVYFILFRLPSLSEHPLDATTRRYGRVDRAAATCVRADLIRVLDAVQMLLNT